MALPYSIHYDNQMIAKTRDIEDALAFICASFSASFTHKGEKVQLKCNGVLALAITSRIQLEEIAESYDRAATQVHAVLREKWIKKFNRHHTTGAK